MSSSTAKVCFNSSCKESTDKWGRGWRRRNGDYANLCDRCHAVYEEGKFCEAFHSNASGWRCCESCGKQIHCGCIISFHMFVLLDAGGIECLTCVKRSYILTPNPAWPPPSPFLPSNPERMKDLPVKPWTALTGSGPVPWRQAPSVFNGSKFQIGVQPRASSEVDLSGGINKFQFCETSYTTPAELKQESSCERLVDTKPGFGAFGVLQNGFTGFNRKEPIVSTVNELQTMVPRNETRADLHLTTSSSCKSVADDTHVSTPSAAADKHVCYQNGVDSSGKIRVNSGKPPRDGRGRNNLLRYHPQISNEELQQISTDSNSVITPLFEKMLTASDAGRIGRLVLPKKCAEAYFPPIAYPEGVALKVQEAKGHEWTFQFRFWPNNNSRMYVLEGITPCIQSMQLQAGDVVTFSRLEPEGTLVIGGRKSTPISSSAQGDAGSNRWSITGGNSNLRSDGARKISGEVTCSNYTTKRKSPNNPINQVAKADLGSTLAEADRSGYTAKNIPNSRRKTGNLGAKSKRRKIENGNSLELNLTWKETQRLMRHPDTIVPSVFVVEGCEFEEFEESPPVIGRPTILWTNNLGEMIQWVQCEDCFKWRKVPADALLPARWVCSGNVWDLDRSSCSAAEELVKGQLEDMLHDMSKVSEEKETTEQGADLLTQDGLDTLANLAIQGGGEGLPALAETTKHPRHKPGCGCIVCLQPPSGKGLNHDPSCDCVVCSSLKRRHKTLIERRDKKQLEREAEYASKNLPPQQSPEKAECVSNQTTMRENNGSKCSDSPAKGQIDLNIQPDREEEILPGSEHLLMNRTPLIDAEMFFRQQRSLSSSLVGNFNSSEKQMLLKEISSTKLISSAPVEACNEIGSSKLSCAPMEGCNEIGSSKLSCTPMEGCNDIGSLKLSCAPMEGCNDIGSSKLSCTPMEGCNEIGSSKLVSCTPLEGCNEVGKLKLSSAPLEGCNEVGSSKSVSCTPLEDRNEVGSSNLSCASLEGCNDIGSSKLVSCSPLEVRNEVGSSKLIGCATLEVRNEQTDRTTTDVSSS